jgi:hypothetical protein
MSSRGGEEPVLQVQGSGARPIWQKPGRLAGWSVGGQRVPCRPNRLFGSGLLVLSTPVGKRLEDHHQATNGAEQDAG